MKALVIFVEITSYNLARIKRVYEQIKNWEFYYVYRSESVSGHEYVGELPANATVLCGNKMNQLIGILSGHEFDFIIVNGYSDILDLVAILYAKMHKIPYAIETDTQMNIPKSPFKRLGKKIMLSSIFSGEAYGFAGGTRQKELFRHYGMNEERIRVMPMCVDAEEFSSIANRNTKEEYKFKYGFTGKKVILYVGRFVTVKNLPELLQSVEMLRANYDDFVCCMIGKGEKYESLKEIVERKHLQAIVNFYPYKKMPELAEWYAMSDVLVLPSSFEPWGLVVNEALASGTPVIVSDKVGAGDDLITGGKNGDVYHLSDISTLTALLEKWLYWPQSPDFSIVREWNFDHYKQKLQFFLDGIEGC